MFTPAGTLVDQSIVVRYLSPAWFDEVEAASAPSRETPDLVLHQVVTGGPDGEVRYVVEVHGDRASLVRGTRGTPDMTFTSDYPTAVAIWCGELSTETALLEGRVRVSGSPVGLPERSQGLAGLDPVPSGIRERTGPS